MSYKLSNAIRRIWMAATGYPMTCIERCRFVDKVSGAEVGLWRDRYGRTYMAEGKFATFRIPFKTFPSS